jgi:hypothetical protein
MCQRAAVLKTAERAPDQNLWLMAAKPAAISPNFTSPEGEGFQPSPMGTTKLFSYSCRERSLMDTTMKAVFDRSIPAQDQSTILLSAVAPSAADIAKRIPLDGKT